MAALRLVVDMVEGGVAALEDDAGRLYQLPLALLPEGVRGGDVLELQVVRTRERSLVLVRPDPAERERRLEAAERMLTRLAGGDPGGDIEL